MHSDTQDSLLQTLDLHLVAKCPQFLLRLFVAGTADQHLTGNKSESLASQAEQQLLSQPPPVWLWGPPKAEKGGLARTTRSGGHQTNGCADMEEKFPKIW